jgi:hypothetical protein
MPSQQPREPGAKSTDHQPEPTPETQIVPRHARAGIAEAATAPGWVRACPVAVAPAAERPQVAHAGNLARGDAEATRTIHVAQAGRRVDNEVVSRHAPATARAAAAWLDFWTVRKWDDGVQVDRLQAFERVRVQTRNSLYEIVVGTSGEAMVRGGRFFADFTPVVVLGSSRGGAFLKVGGIYPGFSMEFLIDGTRIVTSPVAAISGAAPVGARVH